MCWLKVGDDAVFAQFLGSDRSEILCNWMVTVGTLLALISRSTIGKIAAMWLPITTFFAQGMNIPS
jgi:formate/nitrite transporter FocA (FNT family)